MEALNKQSKDARLQILKGKLSVVSSEMQSEEENNMFLENESIEESIDRSQIMETEYQSNELKNR